MMNNPIEKPKLPSKTYLICASQRSGSNLFMSGLNSTGLAGDGREHFFDREVFSHIDHYKLNVTSFVDYVDALMRVAKTPNGVFGTKVFRRDFNDFILRHLSTQPEYAALSMTERIDTLFLQPKYIWLSRRDKLAQAISWVIANATDVWQMFGELQYGYQEKPAFEPRFNYALIKEHLSWLTRADLEWQQYFENNGITPFRVIYEDFEQDYEATLLRALDFMDIEYPAEFVIPAQRITKQRTLLNEEWADKFREIETQSPDAAQLKIMEMQHLQARMSELESHLHDLKRAEHTQFLELGERYRALEQEKWKLATDLNNVRYVKREFQAAAQQAEQQVQQLRSLPHPTIELALRNLYRTVIPYAIRVKIGQNWSKRRGTTDAQPSNV